MTDRHVQRVNWFARDPGGSTTYITPPRDDHYTQRRADLGVHPGESDPGRALGVVVLIFLLAVFFGLGVLIWMWAT